MTPLLELDGVGVDLLVEDRHRQVLRDVSFALDRGEAIGLVGESGSGKSMIARSIVRTLPQGSRTTGRVLLDGEDLLSLDRKALRRVRANRISMIFQDPRSAIDPMWKAGDHLTERLRRLRGCSRATARQRARDLLQDVHIQDPDRVLDAYPHALSGGMLQRVMIAGALSAEPDLLIADEPTTALDATVQSEIAAILAELKRGRGLALLFVTHDLDLAAMLCDRSVVLYAGTVMADQPMQSLVADPAHPYAGALLAARPSSDHRQDRLLAVPGPPASALAPPSGCPFHPRCGEAVAACSETAVSLQTLRLGVRSSCIRRQADLEARNGSMRAEHG